MADSDDLELASEDNPVSGSGNARVGRETHAVRKRINIKLQPSSSKGRNGANASSSSSSKKMAKISKSSHDTATDDRVHLEVNTSSEQTFDDDVSKTLEFSPVKLPVNNSSEPCHKSQKLTWNQKVNLLGEKVVDPLIHSCEKCALPILIYGRMIPCKHVFCFACAKLTEKSCPRCSQGVTRIEQSALGTVFVCTFGGTKHGVSGCHRTYLSQRDLQSHIAHRHFGAGREPQPQRSVQQQPAQSAVVAQPPPGVAASIPYSVSQQQQQPQQQQPPATSMTLDNNAALVYRTMQHPPPQAPNNAGLQHIVITHPPPSLSQPPPQLNQPPPQHLITSHSSSHVMNASPHSGPPGMMPGSHVMPPHGMPPTLMVQSMPPPASRGNLITVQLHEDNDYRVDTGQSSSGSSGGRVQLSTSQTETAMAHYPPPPQQYHTPPGGLVPAYSVADHHQLTIVGSMITHPPPLGPGQPQMGPGQTQLGHGQVMVTYSLPPNQMGPPPSGPAPRLGPPPQLQPAMPPQGMHSGPPPQGMMSAGPMPPQSMMTTGPPPQGMPPPQPMRGAPPGQNIRTGPPPQGYAAPPPHHPDQMQQFVGSQQLTWTTAPPPTGPPQMQHMGPRGSQGNMGSSQSMQYY